MQQKAIVPQPEISDLDVVKTSMRGSVIDIFLNLAVGLFTGSQAVLSQAVQGLSDFLTTIIVYTGVVRSKHKPDHKHPLGYGREVYFWVLLAGVTMFIGTGYFTVQLGWNQITNPGSIENIYLAIAMLLFALYSNSNAMKKSWDRLNEQHGRKSFVKHILESPMVDTKATLIVDFLGSTSAGFGLIAVLVYAITGDARFDGMGALAVGLSMMLAATALLWDVRTLIVGRSVPDSIYTKIREAAKTVPEVLEIMDLRAVYIGSSNLMVLIEVHIKGRQTTAEIEKIIDKIRKAIEDNVENVFQIEVEIESANKNSEKPNVKS